MAQSAELIHNHGDVISTFVGWDSLLLAALSEGAAGVMAGTANVVPAELVAVYDAVRGGRPGGGAARVGAGLPAHRRDHEGAVHRRGQGGHGGGGLPRRRPAPAVRRARPRRDRPHRPARAGTADVRPGGATAGSASVRRACGERPARGPTCPLASTSSTGRSGRAAPARHRRGRPELRAHDRPGRRGHGRGHRRRGGRRGGRGAGVGRADAEGALGAAAPRRRPGRRERRPPRPARVGQHRQAGRGRAGRRGADRRHVPVHGRRAAGADLRGGGPLRRGPPVGHPARAAGRRSGS